MDSFMQRVNVQVTIPIHETGVEDTTILELEALEVMPGHKSQKRRPVHRGVCRFWDVTGR